MQILIAVFGTLAAVFVLAGGAFLAWIAFRALTGLQQAVKEFRDGIERLVPSQEKLRQTGEAEAEKLKLLGATLESVGKSLAVLNEGVLRFISIVAKPSASTGEAPVRRQPKDFAQMPTDEMKDREFRIAQAMAGGRTREEAMALVDAEVVTESVFSSAALGES